MPPAGEQAEPAFVLLPGVAYVSGWATAHEAVRGLRAELAACGLADRVAYLRAEVTVAGVGVVELGRVTPATARLLAELLAAARHERPGPPPPSEQAPRQRAA